MQSNISGILLVDKPKGWTSFDVVARVRGLLRAEQKATYPELKTKIKVGHTGTLDPSATGLLVLCIGKATKLVPTMIKHDKTYEVEMTLGAWSTTGDSEGEIVFSSEFLVPGREEVETAINSFLGEQMQTPPAFSAIKINGKRAYDLARAGKEVKLEPRPVTIHSISLDEYEPPIVRFTCSVSSGTYIRSLVVDIGAKLGVDAYMSNLRRTIVDTYKIEDAIPADSLTIESIHERYIKTENN